jgi:hypothetical protein
MSLNAIKQAIKSAGYAKYVADISEDPEIYEVQLREPWINTEYQETLWVYGKHHLEGGSSVQDMLGDLKCWMMGIEKEAA